MALISGLIDKLPAFGTVRKHEDRAAWLEARKGRMTGSKAAALFGMANDEYLSLYSLWAVESGLEEPPAPVKEKGVLKRGRKMEPMILEELNEVNGWPVEHWPQNWTLDHPDPAARASCTPDGLAIASGDGPWFDGELIAVQVKTANEHVFRRLGRGEDGSVQIPIEHQIQVQIELACLGLDHGVLCLQPSMDLDDMIQIPYERNPEFIARFLELAADFWRRVKEGDAPEVDGSKATAETLKRQFPKDQGHAVRLSAEADVWAAELAMAKVTIKEAEKIAKDRKNKLAAAVGDATFAETPDGVCYSYKAQVRIGINTGKLRDLFPEAAEECETVSRFRVLRPVKTIAEELFYSAGDDEDGDND